MFVQLPAPAGERWNWTDATPEPPSAEFESTEIVPRTTAPEAGAVTEPEGLLLSTRTLPTAADVSELPALSVVITRRSYSPSPRDVVSSDTEYGALVSAEPMFVQLPVPAGERWNCAEATPEPPSAEFESTEIVPSTTAPALGAVTEPVGLVLSTRTFATAAEATLLPALSVVTTRRSYRPSLTAVVSKLTPYGEVVSAAPMFVHVPAPAGERWNCAEATPEPPSAEFESTEIVPRTTAPEAGAVTEPEGLLLSTRTLPTAADVSELPALSVVITRRSYSPSPRDVVSSDTEYGALVSAAPMFVQVPAPAEFASTEIVPRTFAPALGAVTDPVGFVLSTRTFATTADVSELPALSLVTTR